MYQSVFTDVEALATLIGIVCIAVGLAMLSPWALIGFGLVIGILSEGPAAVRMIRESRENDE